MEGKKFLYLIFLQMMYLSFICDVQSCQEERQYSGEIYFSSYIDNQKCWKIVVPDNNYIRLNILQLESYGSSCLYGSLNINVSGTDEKFKFCPRDYRRETNVSNTVLISYFTHNGYNTTFRIAYNIENSICAEKDHFRCSNHSCIHQHQVCDGVKNCENGADEEGCDYGLNCQVEKHYSNEIFTSNSHKNQKCWKIEVPDNNYVRINVKELKIYNVAFQGCTSGFVKFGVAGTGEQFTFCPQDTNRIPINALSDVNITYFNLGYTTAFRFAYNIENLICVQDDHFRCSNHYCIHQQQVCDGVQDCENGADEKECEKLICSLKNHFRCSNHSCIHQHQVCDGVKNCENGADEKGCATGVEAVSGVNISRENSIIWLKGKRSESFGWGKDTHRAITALYLAGAADFRGDNMEEELMAKQLELQTLVALLRNSTDPMSVSDLSMFINALTVTCHDTRQFYGYDLMRILEERVIASKSSNPGAYLTLCNANWTFSHVHVESLLRILQEDSGYPFHLDVQAMTITTLSCVKNKTKNFETIPIAYKLYNSTIQKFIDGQLQDGSFGNIYTTALVTQALLSSGQENNKLWKLIPTVKFLMKELNTTADLLSTYLTLPIFSGKSLVDIANVNCTNRRKQGKDDEISDITNKLGGKARIQYSLYVGDEKDVIHTMYMRVPENSSVYDVMRLAQALDYKYKFQHIDVSGNMYVYTIAGITNDPEARKFWLLYTGDSHINGTVHHHTESPDKFILGDGEHLIMWYKTAHI